MRLSPSSRVASIPLSLPPQARSVEKPRRPRVVESAAQKARRAPRCRRTTGSYSSERSLRSIVLVCWFRAPISPDAPAALCPPLQASYSVADWQIHTGSKPTSPGKGDGYTKVGRTLFCLHPACRRRASFVTICLICDDLRIARARGRTRRQRAGAVRGVRARRRPSHGLSPRPSLCYFYKPRTLAGYTKVGRTLLFCTRPGRRSSFVTICLICEDLRIARARGRTRRQRVVRGVSARAVAHHTDSHLVPLSVISTRHLARWRRLRVVWCRPVSFHLFPPTSNLTLSCVE